MKNKLLKTIILFIVGLFLISSIIILIISCKKIPPSSNTSEIAVQSSSSTSKESTSNEINDIDNIKILVDGFGKVLKNVSLLSPPDILENDMKKYYGPFLSEELLSKWIKDPSEAPGRLTSSPWPDHIEITDVKKITVDRYEVTGNVIEMTSVEAEKGGYADKYEINLIAERINKKWFIAEFNKKVSPNDAAAVIRQFDKLMADGAESYEVISFIDKNISKVEPDNADLMLEKLEYIQRNDIQFYTDRLFEDEWQQKLNMIFTQDIEIKDLEKIKDENLKKMVTEIFNGGFKLIALEGSFYPYIDYDYLKKYSSYLTPQYQDYLDIMATESNKIYSRDAALTISWDELAFRLINCEEYLVQYPGDNIKKKVIGDFYMKYLMSYMIGQNNTPSYSYEDNKINTEVLESYSRFISDYYDSVSANLIKDYQKILTDNNNTVDDYIFKKINDIYKQAVRSFNLDTPELLFEGIRNTYYQSNLAENGYIILINGQYIENNKLDPQKDITIKLSEFTAFGDFDEDGINDAAAILMAEKPDGSITYSLALNLNRYFYLMNIQDKIIGNNSDLVIINLEIKENKIYLNVILNNIEKTMVFGVDNEQLFEY